jgi:hypothetical protein
MAAPFPLVQAAAIYRPFGAGVPLATGIPCRVIPSLPQGRGGTAGPTYLTWTHRVDFSPDYDVRDGCSRASGTNYLTYADGDEVRVVVGSETWVFVVVLVERRYSGTDRDYTRAYCVRDRVIGW